LFSRGAIEVEFLAAPEGAKFSVRAAFDDDSLGPEFLQDLDDLGEERTVVIDRERVAFRAAGGLDLNLVVGHDQGV
jgi:hypothetical protein